MAAGVRINAELVPGPVEALARITGATRTGDGPLDALPNLACTHAEQAVHGTDLGILWECGGGRMMIAFGDTYGEGWCGKGAGPEQGSDWRSNVVGIVEPFDPDKGPTRIHFVEDASGFACEVLPSRKDRVEHTCIPTSGIKIGQRNYIHFMSVVRFGKSGEWLTNYGGFAYSDNDGQTWTKAPGAVWRNTHAGDGNFQQAALAVSEGFVYLFGTPNGRGGDIFLARVPKDGVLEKSQYEYWGGGNWNLGDQTAAEALIGGPAGELSVAYNSHFERWLMTHIDHSRGAILLRDAPALTGPWSSGKVLLHKTEAPGLYGGFIDPLHCDGQDLYFTVSRWFAYNVFWMRARLSARGANA